MAPPLLLYSLGEFRDLIRACLDAADARTLVEIGSETGEATRDLVAFLADRQGRIWCVEPEPTLEVEELDRREESFHLIRGIQPSSA